MSDIFIVVASGGSYDDAWRSNVCAFATREEADLEVIRRSEMHVRLSELDKQASEARWAFLRTEVSGLEQVEPAPKGPAKPTKELNADYQRRMEEWRKKMVPISERNRTRQTAMLYAAVAHARQNAIAAGATEEELQLLGFSDNANTFGYDYSHDTTFSVEQLELISSI